VIEMFTNLIDSSLLEAANAQAALYHCSCSSCAGSSSNDPQGHTAAEQYGLAPGQWAYQSNNLPTSNAGDASTLLSGSKWVGAGAGPTVITYSFANGASQYGAESNSYRATLAEFSAADKALTRTILDNVEAVCNVVFVEVADVDAAQSGQVRYAYSQAPNQMGYAGFAFFPSTAAIGGDVWIGKNQAAAEWDYYRPNLILHETLHAVGLKHPFDGSNTLASQSDVIPNTVMSYSPMAGSSSGALSSYPAEPMGLDIQALQQLYGTVSYNAGNTVYNLASASMQNGFHALWDSGGQDTLDASGVGHAVALDLNAGARSDIGVSVQAFAYFGSGAGRTSSTTVYTSTLSLAPGSQIENATGSSLDDILLGNNGANVLRGGAGNDSIDGRGGDDTLLGGEGNDYFRAGTGHKSIDGGSGSDTLVFSGSRNDFLVSQNADRYTVSKLSDPASVVTFSSIERVEFSDLTLARQNNDLTGQIEGQSGQAFRLYKAALDRMPDAGGLVYQTHALEEGLSLSKLASNFMASPEFTHRFGSPADQAFVTLLYHNVLNREPDAAGLEFHVNRLQHEGFSRADTLVGFSESPENQANVVALVGQPATLFPV
jgi:serralysin